MSDIKETFIREKHSLREAMACIERNIYKIAIIVDGDDKFIDAITDGDIRRAILSGIMLDDSIIDIKGFPGTRSRSSSVVASSDISPQRLQEIFALTQVRQIPVLDEEGRILRIELVDHETRLSALVADACVMAGGLGERLLPLTLETPKPMLSIGGKPLLESTIERLRDCGIQNIWLSINYKRQVIRDHFGDGNELGVRIRYIEEEFPMGTAGSLSLISADNPLLVINGDVVTRVDFVSLVNHHNFAGNDLTVGARIHDYTVPFGVLELDGDRVSGVVEKPSFRNFVNAGIYVLNPETLELIPRGVRYDMTDLIQLVLSENKSVGSFPIYEYWSDIGIMEDYEKANKEEAE